MCKTSTVLYSCCILIFYYTLPISVCVFNIIFFFKKFFGGKEGCVCVCVMYSKFNIILHKFELHAVNLFLYFFLRIKNNCDETHPSNNFILVNFKKGPCENITGCQCGAPVGFEQLSGHHHWAHDGGQRQQLVPKLIHRLRILLDPRKTPADSDVWRIQRNGHSRESHGIQRGIGSRGTTVGQSAEGVVQHKQGRRLCISEAG